MLQKKHYAELTFSKISDPFEVKYGLKQDTLSPHNLILFLKK